MVLDLATGRICDAPERGWHELGWAVDALVGRSLNAFVHPDDWVELTTLVSTARQATTNQIEQRWQDQDGGWHPFRVSLRLLDDGRRLLCAGQPCGAEERPAELTRLRRLADLTDDVLLISDSRGRICYVNAAVAHLHGQSAAEMEGQPLASFVVDGPGTLARQELIKEALANGGRAQGRVPTIRGDGSEAILHVNTVRDAESGLWYTIERDITKAHEAEVRLRQVNAELAEASVRDDLTGLYNRTFMTSEVEHALVRGERFALLLLDLDNFKLVNDSLGHNYGDLLLRLIAARLTRAAAHNDVVARFGGDEFHLLLRSAPEGGEAVAQALAIRDRLAEPFQVNGRVIHTSCSIGVAMADPRRDTAGDVLRNADIAAYRAKETTRNRVILFDAHLQDRVQRRFQIEADLRDALANDQIRFNLQGVFDAVTNGLLGFEALVRWHHPELGTIPPSEFLDVAEACGLLDQITHTVLTRSLEHMGTWLRAGHGVLTINMAPSQLTVPEVADRLTGTLALFGVKPERIVLEISEVGLADSLAEARPVMRRLRQKGFLLAIDDFGKGASSLRHLRDLPVTMVKIDQSFTHRILTDDSARIITASVITLAQQLGLVVVAESIETEEQAQALRDMGCSSFQGYLLHRPCEPAEVASLLAQYQESKA